jgi:hypothetical protein
MENAAASACQNAIAHLRTLRDVGQSTDAADALAKALNALFVGLLRPFGTVHDAHDECLLLCAV